MIGVRDKDKSRSDLCGGRNDVEVLRLAHLHDKRGIAGCLIVIKRKPDHMV